MLKTEQDNERLDLHSFKSNRPSKIAVLLMTAATLLPSCLRPNDLDANEIEGDHDQGRQQGKVIDLDQESSADEVIQKLRRLIELEEKTSHTQPPAVTPRKIEKVNQTQSTQLVSETEYAKYRDANSPRVEQQRLNSQYCERRVTAQDPIIIDLAKKLTAHSRSKEQSADLILKWVRENISYQKDAENSDYHQFPVETLYLRHGDGEDASYLYSSLCNAAGIETVLLYLQDHIAVGVHGNFSGTAWEFRGKQFYFAEAASNPALVATSKFKVGVIPTKYDNASAVIYGSNIDAEIEFKDNRGGKWDYKIPHQDIDNYAQREIERCCFGVDNGQAHRNFVTPSDHEIKEVAQTVTAGLKTKEAKAQALLDFVQHWVTYTRDYAPGETTGDYHQFPLETLIRKRGDCEDSSYLMASLCASLGINCALIRFPDHLAVGVAGNFKGTHWEIDGTEYYYAETTSGGSKIGDRCSENRTSAWVFTLSDLIQKGVQSTSPLVARK